MSYLSSDLITSVKRRASVPSAQNTFQSSDILALADEETSSKLVPLILKNLEEFYVRNLDYSITANQNNYLIPTRAIASKLRDVQLINLSSPDTPVPLERLEPEALYSNVSGRYHYTIQKTGFYLKGNQVILVPTPKTTQNTLRLEYYCRPSKLVDTTVCGLITAIDSANKQITVNSLPSNINTTTLVDFVKANPGFECSAIDQTITNVATNVLTFSADLPSDVSVGDYICQAGQTCVVQVPVELQPLLFQYVVVRILSAQNDLEALQAAEAELQKLEENAQLLISPRVDGKPKRVVNSRGLSRFV